MSSEHARKVGRPLWIGGIVTFVVGWLVNNYATNAPVPDDFGVQLFWIANILIPVGILAALVGGGMFLLAHKW